MERKVRIKIDKEYVKRVCTKSRRFIAKAKEVISKYVHIEPISTNKPYFTIYIGWINKEDKNNEQKDENKN